MVVPLLSTRTTNVELTTKRRDVLKDKLFPLTRYLPGSDVAHFDVVIRFDQSPQAEKQYTISVKLATSTSRYLGVITAPTYAKALTQVRDVLKQQVSQRRNLRSTRPVYKQYQSPMLV